MPALVAGIHVLIFKTTKDVDGRDEPGHDGERPRLPEVADVGHSGLKFVATPLMQ